MSEKIDLSVIIVTYKSEDLIEQCLNAVYDGKGSLEIETIISDNSPNNKTLKKIESILRRYERLKFIKNDKNEGFSRANNIALKKASGKYVLFLNPDMVVGRNTLPGMVEFMGKKKDAGAATCAVKLINGRLDDSCHRGFPTPWRALAYFSGLSRLFPKIKIFSGYNLSYLDFKKTHEIDSLAGSFMIMPYKVGEKLSWWDEDYFFYGEDIDFCYRIKKTGLKIYFVPDFTALHYKGVSSGIKNISKNYTKATLETKRWVTKQRFRAMEIFYDKHYREKYPYWIRKLVFLGIGFKRDIESRRNGL